MTSKTTEDFLRDIGKLEALLLGSLGLTALGHGWLACLLHL